MRTSAFPSALPALGLLLMLAGPSTAQDTNFSTGPQYLLTNGSPLFARPIATPTLSLETQAQGLTELETSSEPRGEEKNRSAESEPLLPADLFAIYYGTPRASETPIGLNESEGQQAAGRPPLPAGFVETGATRLVNAQTLRQSGYGMTLAEAVARAKSRRTEPAHTYTNADIERLRQGS